MLILKVHQGIRHQMGQARIAKHARAIAFIHPPLGLVRDLLSELFPLHLASRLWMLRFPNCPPAFQGLKLLLGNGIRLTKGDSVSCTFLPPVRQMTAIHSNRKVRMESAKSRRGLLIEWRGGHVVLLRFLNFVRWVLCFVKWTSSPSGWATDWKSVVRRSSHRFFINSDSATARTMSLTPNSFCFASSTID